MTREEAIAVLQEFYDYNKTLTPHGDSWLQADITINRYTQEELGKALPTVIAALRSPQPDLITGIVPCGCGGKAKVYTTMEGSVLVQCQKCGVSSLQANPENADFVKQDWNRAMARGLS